MLSKFGGTVIPLQVYGSTFPNLRPRGRGVLNKCLNGEAPPRGPTPLILLYTIFHEKGTPFVYLLLKNGTPFT